MILPNATIGILGGGQLARMLALAAKPMGYRIVVLDPDPHCPASSVVEEVVVGRFDDAAAFEKLASLCDVVTLEFENVPSQHLHALEQQVPFRPSSKILSISRDRILEKRFLNQAGAKTAPYWEIHAVSDFAAATFPAILKTATLGYDGKGQARVANLAEAEAAFLKFGSVPCVLEGLVNFSLEVSVLVARSSVETRCFPVLENQHKNGILDCTLVPASVSKEVARAAQDVALQVANALELHGLLCIEMFVADGQIIVNEIAPRPHNSGHVLTETCRTSQFEQAIRAVCDLPLGDVTLHSSGAMANLLGDVWQVGTPNWAAALEQGAKLHLYQKLEARAGRKMGHLVVVGEGALDQVRVARGALFDRQQHWQKVYASKAIDQVSWYQATPTTSLEMLANANLPAGAALIDVGAGASQLVDALYQTYRITALDISSAALAVSQARLGADAALVQWVNADMLKIDLPEAGFDVWHDRAVFHFLTSPKEQQAYVATLRRALKPNGILLLATFAPNGPQKCSGLEVVRYDTAAMQLVLGEGFTLLESREVTHLTPTGGEQKFVFGLFRAT